jgi:hypothetical protein
MRVTLLTPAVYTCDVCGKMCRGWACLPLLPCLASMHVLVLVCLGDVGNCTTVYSYLAVALTRTYTM